MVSNSDLAISVYLPSLSLKVVIHHSNLNIIPHRQSKLSHANLLLFANNGLTNMHEDASAPLGQHDIRPIFSFCP